MTFIRKFRNRLQDTSPGDEPQATLSENLTDRFAGQDERQATAGLHEFSQAELTEIHAYESSHRKREPVLDKLRYLRQREPLPGYDALEPEAVAAELSRADAATIKRVREYERKHQNRPSANAAIVAAMRDSRKRSPAAGEAAPLG
jgi:hypothetical protein